MHYRPVVEVWVNDYIWTVFVWKDPVLCRSKCCLVPISVHQKTMPNIQELTFCLTLQKWHLLFWHSQLLNQKSQMKSINVSLFKFPTFFWVFHVALFPLTVLNITVTIGFAWEETFGCTLLCYVVIRNKFVDVWRVFKAGRGSVKSIWGMVSYLDMRNQFCITLSKPLIHFKVLCFDTMTSRINISCAYNYACNCMLLRAFTQRNVQHVAYLLMAIWTLLNFVNMESSSSVFQCFPQWLTSHVHQP